MHQHHARRRREIFGAAAVALECNADADRHSQATTAASAAAAPPRAASRLNALPSPASPRRTLVGVAAQLILLCVLMCALEGLFGSSAALLHHLATSDAHNNELRRVRRALPAFGVLHVLLDKSALDALWGFQLLVAAKIHKSALFPEDAESARGASHGVATLAFALMLLSYPLVRFYRRAVVRPWVVVLLLFTLAEGAVLAFTDDLVLPTKHALLFNCSFLACSTFAMAALMRFGKSSTPSAKTAVLAFGVVGLLASFVRARAGVSDSVFVASLAAQLLLTLATRATLTRHPCEEDGGEALESADQKEEDEEEDECSCRSVFRFVDLLATFAIAAGALAVLGLLAAGLRHLLL